MLLIAFLMLYAACTALVLAVVLQDRRRDAGQKRAPEPRVSHGAEFVFRTQA